MQSLGTSKRRPVISSKLLISSIKGKSRKIPFLRPEFSYSPARLIEQGLFWPSPPCVRYVAQPDTAGFSSVFNFPNTTFPEYSFASASTIGPTMRQGPHQGAQQSITVKEYFWTNWSKVESSTLTGSAGKSISVNYRSYRIQAGYIPLTRIFRQAPPDVYPSSTSTPSTRLRALASSGSCSALES